LQFKEYEADIKRLMVETKRSWFEKLKISLQSLYNIIYNITIKQFVTFQQEIQDVQGDSMLAATESYPTYTPGRRLTKTLSAAEGPMKKASTPLTILEQEKVRNTLLAMTSKHKSRRVFGSGGSHDEHKKSKSVDMHDINSPLSLPNLTPGDSTDTIGKSLIERIKSQRHRIIQLGQQQQSDSPEVL
jgi:hypothetical protein